ncbi:MAG: hypothetical protein VX672_06255, partial [Planctomycetota bacterium]|nr:hypothetical protein [Planctomycetota bacterium]
MDLTEFIEGEIPKDALAEMQGHFDDASLRFGTARVRQHRHGSDVLVNAEWSELDDDGPGHDVRHTVVFLHRPRTTLPEFEIRPRKGIGEKMLGALGSLVGVPTLEIEGEDEFNARYAVVTANPDSVRVLLGREAIDSLMAVEDLFLRFSGRGVLASRRSIDGSSGGRGTFTLRAVHDHRLRGRDPAKLVADTLIAGGAIVDDPDLGRRAAAAVEGSYAAEAAQHLEEHGGLIGRQISQTLITGEMLKQLQETSVPRTDIPAAIARRAWGGTTFPLIAAPVFGLLFLGIGIVVSIGDGTEGLAFSGVGVVALIISAFVLRIRLARRNLVIHGSVVEGRV